MKRLAEARNSRRTPVVNRDGRIVFKADSGEATRLVEFGRAVYTRDRRCLTLCGVSR